MPGVYGFGSESFDYTDCDIVTEIDVNARVVLSGLGMRKLVEAVLLARSPELLARGDHTGCCRDALQLKRGCEDALSAVKSYSYWTFLGTRYDWCNRTQVMSGI